MRSKPTSRNTKSKQSRAFGSSRFIPEQQAGVPALTKNELADLVSLKKKRGRREHGLFIAEGVRLLEEALRARINPVTLFEYPPELSERAQSAVNGFRARKVPVRTVNSRDFHKLVDTEQPQGLIGIFRTQNTEIDYARLANSRRYLLTDNISDPGNLGTLVRSAVGFGFDTIILMGESVEPYNPKLVRATAGALFNCSIFEMPVTKLSELKEKTNSRIIVSDLSGTQISQSGGLIQKWIRADQPLAVVIGSESEGCSEESRHLADLSATIAHSPLIESLNASVAGAIIMSHIYTAGLHAKSSV